MIGSSQNFRLCLRHLKFSLKFFFEVIDINMVIDFRLQMFIHPDRYKTWFKILYSKPDILWVAFSHGYTIQDSIYQ